MNSFRETLPVDAEPMMARAARHAPPLQFTFLALTLGVAITLAARGYRFGESNHSVYLIDALRRNDPSLLANDWWTRSTLQYHVVFSEISALLMRLGIIEPAFLVLYLTLAVLLHLAWLRWTRLLGGRVETYLLSVVLYYLLAGGAGLGMYQFLQDGEFLPSNVSNVAMLWGLYAWVNKRRALAGACLGVSGLFHLNYAVVGCGLWAVCGIVDVLTPRGHDNTGVDEARGRSFRRLGAPWLVGTAALILLSLGSILPALPGIFTRGPRMPLPEFVQLYVKLRHPHHYDPSSWPAGLWVSFLLPLMPAAWAARKHWQERAGEPVRRTAFVVLTLMALLTIALLGAGVWYVNETLVQMSLWRFSIFLKLLSCVGAARFILERPHARRATALGWAALLLCAAVFTFLPLALSRIGAGPAAVQLFTSNLTPLWILLAWSGLAIAVWPALPRFKPLTTWTLAALVILVTTLNWTRLGIRLPGLGADPPAYLAACAWARVNTPRDAVFLVPPDEESFRLHAQRAIVVNFKAVPQLASELPEWRDRLRDVLAIEDLTTLPRPFWRTLREIHRRYESLPAAHLLHVAKSERYRAGYLLVGHELTRDALPAGRLVYSNGSYFLYDLRQ